MFLYPNQNKQELRRFFAKCNMRVSNLIMFSSACLLCLTFTSCAPKPVAQVPSAYVSFQPSDQAFICDAPSNWTNSGFSQMGTESGGNFVSGPAKISITSSMIGSILGDLATANTNQASNLASELGQQAPPSKPPAEQAHEQFAAAMVHEYPDYSELNEQSVQSPYGPGEMSEFTCEAGKTHGYRATYLGKDRSVEIVCQCPTEDWAELQSSFQHVIDSIKIGPGSS